MILRKIIKIAATRCHILKLKYTKFDFSVGGAYSAPPDPLDGFKGPTSKGKGEERRKREERRRGWKGEGGGREREKGREGIGLGEGGRMGIAHPLFSAKKLHCDYRLTG